MGSGNGQKRIPELDGIRGLAIALVVAFHFLGGNADQTLLHAKWASWLVNRGWSGVDLFFVMSGFLIGGILLDRGVGGRALAVFFTRRFLRIFPLYYLLLAACWWRAAWLGEGAEWLPSHLFYLQNVWLLPDNVAGKWLGVTWSLAVEEHFYLLLPALMLVFRRPVLFRVIAGLVVLALACRLLVMGTAWQPYAYKFTLCRADQLFVGVLLAAAVRDDTWRGRLERGRTVLYAVLLASAAAMPVLSLIGGSTYYGFASRTVGLWVYAAFYAALLLLAVLHRSSLPARLARLAPLRWLGVRAYSAYLFHMVALTAGQAVAVGAGLDSPFASRLLAAGFVPLICAAAWRFVEAPLIRLGHRVGYGDAPRRVGTSPGLA